MKTDIQEPVCGEQETGREEQDSADSLTSKLAGIPQLSTLVHALTSDRVLTVLGVVVVIASGTTPDQGIIFHPG